jgi:putative ABC transport system permease protein
VNFLLRTLSLSYVKRHRLQTLLTLLGVVVGVATFSAIRGAQGALVQGVRDTVDRMAGKAQLQVSADQGVPEQMQESLRELPGIRAQAPVIEQIVLPARGELGSLLLLGVDLLGDREMRDYGFEGEDADLDDPLLFLAQPDSVAVSRELAQRAGLRVGDSLALKLPHGTRNLVVRGLLTPRGFAEAFGGNLVVMDVYAAQALFGRGRRFDRLELRLTEGTELASGTEAVQAAVGPGYRVETPERRGGQLAHLVDGFMAAFSVSSVFALGIGTFLIFNAFNVSVTRRRRDIGTLRALGATPRQVQALFLVEGLALGVLGGVLGLLVGTSLAQSMLKVMGSTSELLYGVPGASHANLTLSLAVQSIALGVVASLAGALAPSRAASRVHPTEAFAKGSHQASGAAVRLGRLTAGAALLAVAVALGLWAPLPGLPLVFLVLAVAAAGVIALAGPAARALLRRAAPLLARLFPVAGRLAADSLLSSPRRTSGTVLAMTLSITFVLGFGGYVVSAKGAMVRWMENIITSDLYVRASANFVRPDFLFPAGLRQELLRLDGVQAVESFRGTSLPFRGDTIRLVTIEIGPMLDRTREEFLQGDERSMRRGLVEEGKCAVSDNFHRLFGLGVGDVVELATPTGMASFPIAAVFRNFTSERGTVYLDRAVFLERWRDDRVDVFDVNLAKGVDPGAVRGRIRELLGGRMPALVSTRREYIAEVARAIDAFYGLVQMTVLLALVVAVLGIVTSLLISVAERRREIGILKSLGALGAQIGRSVALEGVVLSLVGLALALPLGELMARFMETTVIEQFTGWRMPHTWPAALVLTLTVALPVVSALAAWFPARQAARVKVTEAIEYE